MQDLSLGWYLVREAVSVFSLSLSFQAGSPMTGTTKPTFDFRLSAFDKKSHPHQVIYNYVVIRAFAAANVEFQLGYIAGKQFL